MDRILLTFAFAQELFFLTKPELQYSEAGIAWQLHNNESALLK